jgi:hypothetical protein
MKQSRYEEIKIAILRELTILDRAIWIERAFGGYKYRDQIKVSDLELAGMEKDLHDQLTNRLADLGALRACLARTWIGRWLTRQAAREMQEAGKIHLQQKKAEKEKADVATPLHP